MYLLIFDGKISGRDRVVNYLEREAQRIQPSVWRFRDFRALSRAAELVSSTGGQVMAFMESDRILLIPSDVRRELSKFSELDEQKCIKVVKSIK